MSADARKTKQPGERLAFTFDYDVWLGQDERIVDTATEVSGDDSAFICDLAAVTPGGRSVVLILEGGTHLGRYRVTLTITTDFGQKKQNELEVRVFDR